MKNYNTTDLDPVTAFERHVFHRDQFAHYLRWTHILKEAKIGESIVDFGCGKANLLEVLYRNRFKPKQYVGIDIRKKTVQQAEEKFRSVTFPTLFITADLVQKSDNFSQLKAEKVVSFEVIEHIGKQNAKQFLENFKQCGKKGARYYLSTPNFDPGVGAAGNHTYDSGDGKGEQPQEFEHSELQELILEAGFTIKEKFGTFASQRDYDGTLTAGQKEVYDQLRKYYDSNLVSNIMAPIVEPELARNCLWVLEVK